MKGSIETMKEKGKWHPKEELKFISQCSIEQVEQRENNAKEFKFTMLDQLYDSRKIDFENPPPDIWVIDFQRWMLRRFGLSFVVNFLKTHDYKDNFEKIPDRLSALGDVSEGCIQAAMNDNVIEVKVAGVSFGTRQKALERLTYYAPEEVLTVLVPETDNPYDKNAIAVKVYVNGADRSYCIGYIPRESIQKVAPIAWKFPELIIRKDLGYSASLKLAV